MALLEIRDLAVHFKIRGGVVRAVDGISFEVDRGDAVGLVGESGCGKTTAALGICRLLPKNGEIVGGQVLFDGEDLVAMGRGAFRRRRWTDIALIFQGAMNSLNPVLTVGKQVGEPIELHEPTATPQEVQRRVGELFELVGIEQGRQKQYPHEFSGGMRQRVNIAMALACRPRLIIGDEPTTALDVMVQAQILELLERLRRELGLAMILITHDLSVVAETCDRAVVMYAGRLAETGDVGQLYERPLHPYTERLMRAVPDITGARLLGSGIPGQPPDLVRPPSGCRFNPRCDRAMSTCTSDVPAERSFGAGHRVACHAVTSDGRLAARADLPVLVHAPDPPPPIAASAARPESTGPGGGRAEWRNVEVHFPLRGSVRQTIRGEPRRAIRAVDGVSLELERGEIVALVGESGCGKTTTGRALVRLVPITGGQVLLDDADVGRLSGRALREYRRHVQIIFQDPYESLNPKQTIMEVVAEPLVVQHMGSAAERRDRVVRALEEAGLRPATTYMNRFPHELSGGQRQRVAIAAAMVVDPDIVVADEPVSMLDVSVRAGILRIMLDLRAKRGVGYLFITHDLSLAWLIADRIAVMYLGKIVEEGPAERIVAEPRHPYTQALLSVMPSPNPTHRRARTILKGETPDASRIPPGCRFHPRCPLARAFGILERCTGAEPPLFETAGGSRAACWLAEPGGPFGGGAPWRGLPVISSDGSVHIGDEVVGLPPRPTLNAPTAAP